MQCGLVVYYHCWLGNSTLSVIKLICLINFKTYKVHSTVENTEKHLICVSKAKKKKKTVLILISITCELIIIQITFKTMLKMFLKEIIE